MKDYDAGAMTKYVVRVVEYVMLMAVLVLLALMLTGHVRADTPAPADICTGSYFYKDACGDWRAGWPGDGDATTQGNCAHGFMAKDDSDGVWYYIVGAGPGGKRYPQPRESAPFARSWWAKCFVAHDPSMVRSFPSCALPSVGGTWSPALVPLSSPLIPPAKKASWTAQFHCAGPTPTPGTPTRTPTHSTTATRTPSRTKTPTPGGCVGPGGVPCPTPTSPSSTPTPTTIPTTVTETMPPQPSPTLAPTSTATAAQPTPAPARTVLPPSTRRPSPQPVTPRATAIRSSTPSASPTVSEPTTTATAVPSSSSSPTPTSTEKPRNGCLGATAVAFVVIVGLGRALTWRP